jgi:hypothetical protein
MRIGFLFNHMAGHQVAHALPIAMAMGGMTNSARIEILASPGETEGQVRRSLARYPGSTAQVCILHDAAPLARALHRASGRSLPVDRLSILHRNLERFRALDALVTPEKTALKLRSMFGLDRLKFIHTRHGAGDRAIGFDKASGEFDMVLVSGPKIRDRLAERGLINQGGYAIVGYPKFDVHSERPKSKLFDNDLPTVVYNPHPSPALSSWYRFGADVLRYFAGQRNYNLVFAPHVMLFRKRINVSLSPLGLGLPGSIPKEAVNCPHILIDTNGPALLDMTYTDAADIYLGDASSQVYEFLRTPRPCIFLNPARQTWHGDADFAHWQTGPVVHTIAELDRALKLSTTGSNAYARAQEELFRYSFDLTEEPSSRRAAKAILKFLGLR